MVLTLLKKFCIFLKEDAYTASVKKKDRYYMKKEVIVEIQDESLLYLNEFLLSLDNYKFDKEILKLLNDLRTLVNNKLFENIGFDDYDITGSKLFYKFILEKNKNCVDNIII